MSEKAKALVAETVDQLNKLPDSKKDKAKQKYTTEIDYVLNCMQREGYEILDIKFNSIPNQGVTGNRTGFNTLITYR